METSRLTERQFQALRKVRQSGRLPYSAIHGQTRVRLFNKGLLRYVDMTEPPECEVTEAGLAVLDEDAP